MRQENIDALQRSIEGYSLPRYDQIPEIGLYLEQLTKYISEYTEPLGLGALTGSMVSNYVKQGIVNRPVKKQYGREQIAHLIFIALAKSILSLDDLQQYILLQQRTYAVGVAYDYFRKELESALRFVFEPADTPVRFEPAGADEKNILRNIVITIAHKIYLEKYIAAVTEEQSQAENS